MMLLSFTTLGVGYYLIGENKKALEKLHSTIHLEKENASYLFNLANAYAELEEYGKAKKYYLHALLIDPEHIPFLTNLADCYESRGEIDNAHKLFEYVNRFAPQNALAFLTMGTFYFTKISI